MDTVYLKEKRDEYLTKLENMTVPVFLQGVLDMYANVKKTCKVSKNVLKEFQQTLREIKEWDADVLHNEHKRFYRVTKCEYFDSLVLSIFKAYYLMNNIDTEASFPRVSKYLHECYLNIARQLWKNPFLVYDVNVSKAEQQKNMHQLEKIIGKCIKETFIRMLPFTPLNEDFLVTKPSVAPPPPQPQEAEQPCIVDVALDDEEEEEEDDEWDDEQYVSDGEGVVEMSGEEEDEEEGDDDNDQDENEEEGDEDEEDDEEDEGEGDDDSDEDEDEEEDEEDEGEEDDSEEDDAYAYEDERDEEDEDGDEDDTQEEDESGEEENVDASGDEDDTQEDEGEEDEVKDSRMKHEHEHEHEHSHEHAHAHAHDQEIVKDVKVIDTDAAKKSHHEDAHADIYSPRTEMVNVKVIDVPKNSNDFLKKKETIKKKIVEQRHMPKDGNSFF